MKSRGCDRKASQFVAVSGLLLSLPLAARAEKLGIKVYTPADGLPHPAINRIVRDSHGFLWICTQEGLSRFDGYSFTNYTRRDGLPSDNVWDLLQTRGGDYWVATSNGISRFNPKPRHRGDPMFVTYRAQTGQADEVVYTLNEANDGAIWCGTDAGLLRFHRSGADWKFDVVEIGSERARGGMSVESLLEDRSGALWVAGVTGLYRRVQEGRTECYYGPGPVTNKGTPMEFDALLQDRGERLWAGGVDGLYQLPLEPRPHASSVARVYTSRDGLIDSNINALLLSQTGRLWIGTDDGIAELFSTDARGHARFRNYGTANGLINSEIETIAEDGEGNLWLGSHGGLMRLARNGFTTYGAPDGLTGETGPASVFEDRAGHLCVIPGHRSRSISRFDGSRFVTIVPDFPKGITHFGWGWNQINLQDHLGDWWIPTSDGLCRFPRVKRIEDLAHIPPKAVYTTRDGLPWNNIFRLYEDSRGDVWISTIGTGKNGLTRWDRRTRTFQNYLDKGWLKESGAPSAFAEDRAGDLWIGFYLRSLMRYRHGQFDLFTTRAGAPDGSIEALHVDRAGRLWIASGSGLGRVDDPAADHPRFVTYTTASQLSSNHATCIAEDRYGRLYVGTGRGIDRLSPDTGHFFHYTTSDGLPPGTALTAFRDRNGRLWFGGELGLVRFDPEPPTESSPPAVRISGVRVRDLPQPVSELGEMSVTGLDLGPDQSQIQIAFAGLNFGLGEVIKYQYELEGADRDWSELTELHTVTYARLAPGRYRFLVRGVNSDGMTSAEPAIVSFRILPPIWRRWWFLTLAGLLTAAAAYGVYRLHLDRLLELERVRTRIATDLHDDIGASLTQIAIMSEVVRQQASASETAACPLDPHQHLSEPLARIADLSRELVDSMSDIVWAINPRRDHLSDLAYRMRRFASDVFSARNVEFDFLAPYKFVDASLTADVRRQVFLVFKESVNNIARHSGCHHVGISLDMEGSRLLLKVSDDGRGFELSAAGDGSQQASCHGLSSMEHRARDLGGSLHVISQPSGGTCILLEIPVSGGPFLSRKRSLPKQVV